MAVGARAQVPHNLSIAKHGFVVIEQGLRVAQAELQQAFVQPLFFFRQNCVTSDEIGFFRFHGKAKARLKHVVFTGDVMAKMAKRLFDAATVHHMHPAKFQPVIVPCLPKRFKCMGRHIAAHIYFPAKFAHIAHPMHPCEPHAKFDLLHGAKGVCCV